MVFAMMLVLVPMNANAAGTWMQNATGWWYQYDDGTYPVSQWLSLNGNWYYFDEAGYMCVGPRKIGSQYYYFDNNGVMRTGWVQENGVWRYCDVNGIMYTGWNKVENTWYYFGLTDGVMATDTAMEAGTIKGIDVSKYQGNIDWAKVKADGIQFSFVRVGHGQRTMDPYFKQNMAGANKNGIPAGVYFYSTAQSEEQALGDAQFVIDSLKGYTVSYPIAIDLEDESQKALGKEKITAIAKVFCDEVRAAGYTPMVYCNEVWAQSYIDFSKLPGVGRWIARYNRIHNTNIPRDIWQSGSTCHINGITQNVVDINFGTTDYTKIVTPRTGAVGTYTKSDGLWKQNNVGWWYAYTSGGFPANQWKYIQGNWYYFDGSGYMVHSGWRNLGGVWYYFKDSGEMYTGWLRYGNAWYYLNSNGAMATGWVNLGGTWYYMNAGGVMQTGWINLGGTWYYLNAGGDMATGWLRYGNNWYYLNAGGNMATGWINLGGTWYYLNAGGAMATGWINLGGTWYYLNAGGDMATGWIYYGNTWYYLYSSGAMATNTWIGNYYVNSGGAWVQ